MPKLPRFVVNEWSEWHGVKIVSQQAFDDLMVDTVVEIAGSVSMA